MLIKRTFHIDAATLARLVEHTHGRQTSEACFPEPGALTAGVVERILVESLAHHLTKAAKSPATVTVVSVERFAIPVPGGQQ